TSSSSTLFPYTTLFRSVSRAAHALVHHLAQHVALTSALATQCNARSLRAERPDLARRRSPRRPLRTFRISEVPLRACNVLLNQRSEEHTSELQSQSNLV